MPRADREAKLAYQRDWYQRNREQHIKNCAAQAKVRMKVIKREIRELKESSPCADCGNFYPYFVMQFDHVRGKKIADVGRLLQLKASRPKIMAEIAKCDLVCANCHAIRTWGHLAQLEERCVEAAEVEGSIPSVPTF